MGMAGTADADETVAYLYDDRPPIVNRLNG